VKGKTTEPEGKPRTTSAARDAQPITDTQKRNSVARLVRMSMICLTRYERFLDLARTNSKREAHLAVTKRPAAP
jgi:hypothetical protein